MGGVEGGQQLLPESMVRAQLSLSCNGLSEWCGYTA